ncbi:MAG: twin-arginine translocase TatA/TatE family subunit [Desulfovibrionaceae bacterium]|nr:twin-arginine translocase TatA/TatE family subunit [Desulfovibrionaceae bacterium]
MLGPIGPTELILILLVVLVLFGSKKLPEIGQGLGRAIRNFRRATSEPAEVDITPKAEKEGARQTTADERKA